MDCAQCRGLVERSCPPQPALGHAQRLADRQTQMLEAASGQPYPASTEATRLALTGAQRLARLAVAALPLCFCFLKEIKDKKLLPDRKRRWPVA